MAAAIPLALGAVAGGVSAADEERQTERFNRATAEGNKFSDVTGVRGNLRQGPAGGVFGGALKGASTFGALGQAFGGAPTTGVQDLGGSGFVSGAAQSPVQFSTGGFSGGQPTNRFGLLNA